MGQERGERKNVILGPRHLPRLVWLGLAGIVGVVLMAVGSGVGGGKAVPNPVGGGGVAQPGGPGTGPGLVTVQVPETPWSTAERELEERLARILEQVAGVGQVSATVFLAAGPRREYASDLSSMEKTTEETDQSGGTRKIVERTSGDKLILARMTQGGLEDPVVVREVRPDVQGVLVVASGAAQPGVRAALQRAVETALGIPAYKVTVLPRQGGER